jgi:hypothetical protein
VTEVYEDLPNPDVDDLLQREPVTPTVPTRVEGPVTTYRLPSRVGATIKQPLTTDFQHVLGSNEKRARALLVADVDWEYSRGGSAGSGIPWYAKVPLTIEHCDAVYARVPTSTGTLSVVAEVWAD